MQKSKEVCPNAAIRFFGGLQFPSGWLDVRSSLRTCGAIIMNVGQWPCSNRVPTPWKVGRYEAELNRLLLNARMLVADTGARLLFVATNPSPLRRDMLTCPPTDWRFPHIIQEYNVIARAAAQRWNFTFVDTSQMAFQLLDLSFDGAHYDDPIGRAMAIKLAQAISSLSPPHPRRGGGNGR